MSAAINLRGLLNLGITDTDNDWTLPLTADPAQTTRLEQQIEEPVRAADYACS